MERRKKFFKRLVSHFFDSTLEREASESEIDLLFEYDSYIKYQAYKMAFNIVKLKQEYCSSTTEPKPEAFVEGFELCGSLLETLTVARDNEISALKQQVSFLKDKNNQLKETMAFKVKEFELKTLATEPLLAKMELAFRAGQESIEPIIRHKTYGDSETYASTQRKYNFSTWCNKIWKYGKAIKANNSKIYKNIELDQPIAEVKENLPRGERYVKKARPNQFFAPNFIRDTPPIFFVNPR